MLRRGAVVLTAAVVMGAAVSAAGAGNGGFDAKLRGYEEVPPISTDGAGTFSARIQQIAGQTVIRYRLEYEDLESTAVAAHIHFGQRRVNGGVSAFLCGGGDKPPCPPSGEVRGTIDAADVIGPANQGIAAGELDELIDAMEAGVTYVNVHSEMFPGGEIRGQVSGD